MYKLSKRSLSRLEGIEPILIEIAKEAIKNSPFDFGIPRSGGLRTAEEQKVLFDKGRSKCDGTMKQSYHQSGKAFDVFAYVDGGASWDSKYLEPIAKHILSVAESMGVELEWGGNWKSFRDMPHFQI